MSQAQWYALASVSGLGSVMAHNLLNRFGSIRAIYQATDEQLLCIPRFSPPMLIALRGLNLTKFQNELDTLAREIANHTAAPATHSAPQQSALF